MAGFEEHGAGVVSAFGKKIRLATEDETFDLAGMNEQQVHDAMVSAFSEPWPHLSGMIRLTFIVGGGRLVRQRYDEDMGRWVSQALKSVGFEEDKSAVADLASRRRFKHHHDTGKNLKTFVVFPDVPDQPQAAGGGGGAEAEAEEGAEGPWEVEVCLNCPVGVFGDMAAAMAPTWWQKQRLAKDVLTPRVERMDAIEQKMVAGEKLDHDEAEEYELLSGASLKEKVEWLTSHMKAQVDEGRLTANDIDKLKSQVEGRLTAVREEADKAKAEAAPAKKVEKLEGQAKALEERRAKLQATAPITHPLRKQEELVPLWRRQAQLQHEKAAIKGRLLTLPELRKFSEIDRLEESIVELVKQSRTFFEDEDGLQARAQAARKKAVAGVAAAKKKPASSSSSSASGGGSKPASAQWTSVGAKKKTTSSGGGAARKAGANAFAALGGGDSDSD